jgi:hypothetical protein
MPYDNPYNRMISNEMNKINHHFINHIAENQMAPFVNYTAPFSMVDNTPAPIEGGSGFASGSMMDTGYEQVLGAVGKNPPKKKAGKGKQTNKDKEDEKLGEEVKELKEKVGGKKRGRKPKPKQEGKGLLGDIGGTIDDMFGGKKKGRKSKKDKEDEKLGMEVKGLKDKLDGGNNPFISTMRGNENSKAFMSGEEKLKIIQQEGGAKKRGRKPKEVKMGGVAEYKKKGGNRKLLSPEEMQPSQMSGNGKKKNPWLDIVKETKEKHPELKGLKEITAYIKKNKLYNK